MRIRKGYQDLSPEIAKTLDKLKKRYAKYALPDEEARKIVDAAMGEKTFTEALNKMREG